MPKFSVDQAVDKAVAKFSKAIEKAAKQIFKLRFNQHLRELKRQHKIGRS